MRCTWSQPCEWRPVRIARRLLRRVGPLLTMWGESRCPVLSMGCWCPCARVDGRARPGSRASAHRCSPSPRRLPRVAAHVSACGCVGVRAQGGAMDELGELIHDMRTLAEEILQRTTYFSESFWPAGVPPEDEEERRAVVASWLARIRGELTTTPPARRFEVACCASLAPYASLTEEAVTSITDLLNLHTGSLTDGESCDVMAALATRLPALRSLNVSGAQLRALVPVWREMAEAGRPVGLIHLGVRSKPRPPRGPPAAPGAPVPPLPPLGDLLPRLQSLYLSMDEPDHVAPWCAMLVGDSAPALAALTLPSRDELPDEQVAMCVDVLRRQAGSLRKLDIQPLRMSAGAAEALDAAIVALPHLVTLHASTVQVDGGSVRVLGGRAPHLRKVHVSCCGSTDPAAFLIGWQGELAPSVEHIELACLYPQLEGLAAPTWRDLASALRALGARPALRNLSLSVSDDGVPWLQSVVSPSSDVAAAPVWPHLQELEFEVVLLGRETAHVELDLRHFPRVHKMKVCSTLLSAAAIAGVMRSAVCRDVGLHNVPVLLTAADAGAFTPKERLLVDLFAATAEETLATLASVVGGWPDLRELHLSAGQVREATQVALARAVGRCTELRELCISFPLCPAAVDVLAEALPRLSEVTRIEVGDVTTTSLLSLVRGLLGTGRHAGSAVRTLQTSVIGTGDPTKTTDDLRELGSAVAAAGQQGWVITFQPEGNIFSTVVELLSQVQVLALRRDWRDCIVPLCTVEVTSAGYTLFLQECGLVAWDLRE
jgi:hypothetical protein